MHTTQLPVHVYTGWIDFSPALQWYAAHKVRSALSTVASHVRSVTVRIADHESHDPSTRLCVIDVTLKAAGTISATATGTTVWQAVDCATEAAVEKFREYRHSDPVHPPCSRIA
jgi:hypothetical protein